MSEKKHLIYVGSWGNKENGGHGEGVYVVSMDPDSGALHLESTLEVEEPSVVALSPDGKYLYSTNELNNGFDGEYGTGGGVTAMAISPEDGSLSIINKTPSLGSLPCFIEVDPKGEYVLAAIHSGFGIASRWEKMEDGSFICKKTFDQAGIALFKVQENGGVKPVDFLGFTDPGSFETYKKGESMIRRGYPGRLPVPPGFLQTHPFIHNYAFITDDLFFATDRGTDQVYLIELDREHDSLHRVHTVRVDLGQAPRHMTLHPTKPYMYMTNEIESSLSVFEYDIEKKSFWRIQTTGVTKDQAEETWIMPCDIHIHPSGKFLYVTNRFLNDLVVFDVDGETGKVSMKQIYQLDRDESKKGKGEPRSFAITSDGRFLVVCLKEDDALETLAIASDGTVSATGHIAAMATPCSLRILE